MLLVKLTMNGLLQNALHYNQVFEIEPGWYFLGKVALSYYEIAPRSYYEFISEHKRYYLRWKTEY